MNLVKTKPFTLDQINALTICVAKYLREGDVVALTGDLGAGKTTLISKVAQHMGLQPGSNVSSPTYVIHHIYPAKFPIHHIDLYRMDNAAQVNQLGFEEFLGKNGVVFIEWFEKFPHLWAGPTLHIQIEILDLDHRQYTFMVNGPVQDHWTQLFDEIQKRWNI